MLSHGVNYMDEREEIDTLRKTLAEVSGDRDRLRARSEMFESLLWQVEKTGCTDPACVHSVCRLGKAARAVLFGA